VELRCENIVLDLAQLSQEGDLSRRHFGVFIIFHEAFDVLDGNDLLGMAVLSPVNLSIRP
jgi:hypothetical protein